MITSSVEAVLEPLCLSSMFHLFDCISYGGTYCDAGKMDVKKMGNAVVPYWC